VENVKHKFSDLSQTKLRVEVEIQEERVAVETEKVFAEIQKHSAIKGFRPGKAPMDLVREKYTTTARQHAAEDLINDTLPEILKERDVNTIGAPVIEKFNFEFEKPFTYSAVVEFHPKVAAKNYRGLKVKKEIKKITEKDINSAVEELRKMHTKLVEAPGPAGPGDCVIVNYTVYSADKKAELKELNARNQLIDLSEKQMLQGLSEALAGVNKGDKKEVATKIPEQHPRKNLAGKPIVMDVEVAGIKKKMLPELNDEFAKESGAENAADLRLKIRERLVAETEKAAEEKLEEQMTDHLLESNNISVPQSLVDSQKNYLFETAVRKLIYQGLPKETLEKQKEVIEKKTAEEALRQVRIYYIFDSIAGQEKIDVTEDEFNLHREAILKINPGREQYVEQYFQEGQERLMSKMKTEKVFKFLKENAKIKIQEA
jgi:trigger factor